MNDKDLCPESQKCFLTKDLHMTTDEEKIENVFGFHLFFPLAQDGGFPPQ